MVQIILSKSPIYRFILFHIDFVWSDRFVKSDDNMDLYAIFYQNEKMKEMYDRNPDILFVDTTYCLNNIKYPALAMVVQD